MKVWKYLQYSFSDIFSVFFMNTPVIRYILANSILNKIVWALQEELYHEENKNAGPKFLFDAPFKFVPVLVWTTSPRPICGVDNPIG